LAKSKILVDGNCIVCDWEISHYKRIAPTEFEIVDISAKSFNAAAFSLENDAVQKHLHVIDPEGKLHIGVDAFSHIWSKIPKYNWASTAINLPGVYSLANIGYWGFAVIRPYLPKKK